MSVYLMQIDFGTTGPFKIMMSEAYKELAEDIALQPGLLWKIWTENEDEQRAGGWYAFQDRASLVQYKEMHHKRLESFGIKDIRSQIFEANIPLSVIDHFPVELFHKEEIMDEE